MKRIENLDFYDLLEVSPSATTQEIHKAYERLRKVYDPNSIALYSLFTPEETAAIQRRIEEAYRTLIYENKRKQYDEMLKARSEVSGPAAAERPQRPAPQPEQLYLRPDVDAVRAACPPERPQAIPPPAPPGPAPEEVKQVSQFIGEFSGPAIKSLREQSGLDLRSIAEITKVSIRYLELIEEENFLKLPARPYIRGFLIHYAKALGCDAEWVANDYLKRYDEAMKLGKK